MFEFSGVKPVFGVFSLKSRYAEAILSGRKTHELRRRRPNLPPGTVVFLYSTSPKMEIVGVAEVSDVTSLPLDLLWQRVKKTVGIDKEAFYSYFAGVEVGHAVRLTNISKSVPTLPLATLRKIAPQYQPPQFYHRIVTDHPLYDFLLQCANSREVAPHSVSLRTCYQTGN